MKRILILISLISGLLLLRGGLSLANPAEREEIKPQAQEEAVNQGKNINADPPSEQSAVPGTHEVGAPSAVGQQETLGGYEFNMLGLGLRVILALGLIVGVIYLVFRFFLKGKGIMGGASFISILATAPLAPNRYLQLVELPGRILVLGIGEKGINFLTEIKDKEEIDLIKTQSSREGIKNHPFSHYLKGFLGRFGVEERESDPYEERLNFLIREREHLARLEVESRQP
ncbi:MAG: flagellar biosynthetic protein FliO [bacterium]